MSREQYVAIARYMVQHSKIKGAFVWAQRALAGLVYACYPCFLLYSLLTKGVRVFWVVLVLPAVCFLGFSAVRRGINAPRPGQVYGFVPVLEPGKQGCSFPSRHTFSAFLIAGAVVPLNTAVGCGLCLVAALIGAGRVIGGVHFVRDVAMGAALGAGCGICCAMALTQFI